MKLNICLFEEMFVKISVSLSVEGNRYLSKECKQRNVSLLVRLVSRSLNSIEQPLFFSSFLFLQPNPMHRMNIPYLYRSNLVSWPLEPLRQHIGKSLLERSFALPCQTFPGRRGRPDLWEPSFCLFSLPPGPSLHPDADNKALFKKEAPTEQERSKSSF